MNSASQQIRPVVTRVSEAMWDATEWLGVYDLAETRLGEIIDAARVSTLRRARAGRRLAC